MAEKHFPELFRPGRIGEMVVPNRIVMPPMATNLASEEGYVTQRTKDYYEERARGGVGLVIVEATSVELSRGRAFSCQLNIDDDKFTPGLAALAEALHRHGAKVAIQLHHGGRLAITEEIVAPSAVQVPPARRLPRALREEEVAELVVRFARAARRAMEAGFDGVEIHSAHGYLVSQFLSSATNKREDEYGGDLRGKARFLLEIIAAARKETGGRFPVWCRLNAQEQGLEGGITLEETRQVAKWAEEAGAAAIHVSTFGVGSYGTVNMPHNVAALVPFAEEIKKVVKVPVIAVGRMEPAAAARALREGKADFIAIGRALIAEPHYVLKASSGRLEDIRPCIGCYDCLDFTKEGTRCTVNPAMGREREHVIGAAAPPKRVLVVGGGPAGMEAARVAALRGHKVTLLEKETRLGGQLLQAALPPQKERIQLFKDYLIDQIHRLGVEVKLGVEADSRKVEEAKAEVVIVATGVVPFTPDIPGIGSAKVVTAQEVLEGKAEVGERVVVMGGELVGCETADFLAQRGKRVTITRRGPRLATKRNPYARRELLDRLAQKGVRVLTEVKYEEITPQGLVITTKEGKKETLEADTIVLAAGAQANRRLFQELEGKVPELYLAGDSVEPRRLHDALADGARIALKV